jgi:hypothetical protein
MEIKKAIQTYRIRQIKQTSQVTIHKPMNQCSITSQKSNGQKGREFKSNARSVMWDCALVSVFKNTTQNSECDVSAGDGRSS